LKPSQLKETAERYIYEEYTGWDDDERCELIDGVIHMLSSPSQAHQETLLEIGVQFRNLLKGSPCKVFMAPFDVCLSAKGDKDSTVVQPDIFVVCDKSKLDGKRCNGAPDMVVEILSASTSRRDMVIKFNKYLQAGVREYWMIDPDRKIVLVNILENGNYIAHAYCERDIVPVHILDGCKIDMRDVFTE